MSTATTGGLLLAQALARHDQKTVYTLHGGHLDAFLVECADLGIRLVDVRHEASAGHAADAHARQTGRASTAVVTSGPGFLNLVTALGNAKLDRVPMLAIVGAPPLRESETNALQGGFDQIALAREVTKWAHQVTHAVRIPEAVARAIAIAEGGTPGPVLLEIPIDVMFDEADLELVRVPSATRPVRGGAVPQQEARALADRLTGARRPLIVAGGTVHSCQGSEAVRALAERGRVPVLTPNKSEGVVPTDSPLYAAGIDTLGGLIKRGSTPDLVLLLGQRQGMFTGGRASLFPGAEVVQVDLDAAELARIADVDIAINADPGLVAGQLLELTDREWCGDSDWLDTVAAARDAHREQWTDATTPSGRLHPYFAAQEVVAASPADCVFVLDGAENASWAGMHTRARHSGEMLRLGYLGALGVGQGFAIGAQIASGKPVVLFQGDGSAGFNIAETDTMVRHGLPIITVIFNNMVWGMSIHGQNAVYGDRGEVISSMRDTDWDQVGVGFGAYGERVPSLEDVAPAMQRAIDSGGPAVLNLEVCPQVEHPITRRMLGDVSNPEQIVVPYYENLPRP